MPDFNVDPAPGPIARVVAARFGGRAEAERGDMIRRGLQNAIDETLDGVEVRERLGRVERDLGRDEPRACAGQVVRRDGGAV